MSETMAWRLLMETETATVTIKPRGHSMEPIIKDKQQVTIRKLTDDDVLDKGDIVLVRVRGHVYLHKISAIDGNRVQISNNHGHVNGWTTRQKIAGKYEATRNS